MSYDIWVDFQRMQDDGRLLARARNARDGLTIVADTHVLVGCEDAEPAVAHVLSVSADGSIELRVLPGAVSEHRALLKGNARLAALLSAPRVSDLHKAGVTPDDLDAIEEVGLVTVDDAACVRFVHPVHASAVRAGIPAGVRRNLHALLAEASTDRDERARHLAQCTAEPDDEVAAELAEVAERVRTRGAPDLAADFYDRAAALTVDPAGATTLRLRSLSCLFECGSYHLTAELADSLVQELEGDPLAEALLLRAGGGLRHLRPSVWCWSLSGRSLGIVHIRASDVNHTKRTIPAQKAAPASARSLPRGGTKPERPVKVWPP